jgi:hypothetical protein
MQSPLEDETTLTEITLLPDGRVYVFGLSQPVLEILGELQSQDQRVRRLLEQTAINTSEPVVEEEKLASDGSSRGT